MSIPLQRVEKAAVFETFLALKLNVLLGTPMDRRGLRVLCVNARLAQGAFNHTKMGVVRDQFSYVFVMCACVDKWVGGWIFRSRAHCLLRPITSPRTSPRSDAGQESSFSLPSGTETERHAGDAARQTGAQSALVQCACGDRL